MNNNFKNNDNDDIFEINSDINGNEELYLLEHGNVSPSKSDETGNIGSQAQFTIFLIYIELLTSMLHFFQFSLKLRTQ